MMGDKGETDMEKGTKIAVDFFIIERKIMPDLSSLTASYFPVVYPMP